jgi:hypothetical protein
MSIQEVSAEQLAERFHHYDQALRADHNRASEPDTEAWEEIPHQERSRLVAAARLTLLDLTSMVEERENARRYFAKPGEAEWGCWNRDVRQRTAKWEIQMNKNWSPRQLLAKTRDKASEQDTAKEGAAVTRRIRFGDFKIDLDERIVTLRDQELRLTSEEFDVLVFLASHPRSLVTPQTMLARI